MNKDKDPIMSDMKPSQDDIVLRQRQLQARKAAAARSGQGPKAPTAAKAPAAKQTLATVSLVLTVVVGALAGLLFMQLQQVQQSLSKAEEIMLTQAQNLDVLNEKLSVTGENANMSVDALKNIVKEHDSEIRKLWDVSYKTNKSDIANNAKKIAAKSKEIATLTANTKATKGSINSMATEQKQLEQRLAKIETRTKALAEIELRLSQQGESNQVLQNEITKLKKSGVGLDAAEIRLKLEDINIRLDRMQNALGQ